MLRFKHLVHSIEAEEGGVSSSVLALHKEIEALGVRSMVCTDRVFENPQPSNGTLLVAHGLWHWPTHRAYQCNRNTKCPYFIFPHGMLDPWFKETYRLKHFKKQLYWWFREGMAVNNANALCFTAEEEKNLAQTTFFPYRAKQEVIGLGVQEPPLECITSKKKIIDKYPSLSGKRILLYLGRFHPKKGVDMLLEGWIKKSFTDSLLVLAGPTEEKTPHLMKLIQKSESRKNILWTGMLRGNEKWEMLRLADSLILPSHQENFGMVVAEALAMGKPVYLTKKVNLWREVMEADAGAVVHDNQTGIDELLENWNAKETRDFREKARACFEKKLHIRSAAARLIALAEKTFQER